MDITTLLSHNHTFDCMEEFGVLTVLRVRHITSPCLTCRGSIPQWPQSSEIRVAVWQTWSSYKFWVCAILDEGNR
jgi:hypothetical protein